jgi:mono/diheme cytochrome c family protein
MKYQYALITCSFLLVCGVGAFVYREVFPEYKEYQKVYVELEKFRSSYTQEKPAPFSYGIKQLVLANNDGPETIDRCISCHVAMDLPHFSPKNPEYVWDHFQGSKTLVVDGKQVNLEKVIQMHPLMPGETKAFQFHPMSEYGCTSCHSGNGRALVAKRAHGPVYDGDYHPFYTHEKPQFTEVDPEKDPPFSRMYNHKPSHDLIFQTTPILSGPLIVANCVQCHQGTKAKIKEAFEKISQALELKPQQLEISSRHVALQNEKSLIQKLYQLTEQSQKVSHNLQTNVDVMIAGYHRGKELFISQGCYACHRIAGYSRASIGPELTQEGNSYPWFVKESIVWPQADLPSSTMPNFRLDHDELADLMTFLMAQKGNNKAISEVDYKIELHSWENGAQMPWEKPVPPAHIENLSSGMHVFATEGCASCHKLQGFETNTSLKNPEKDRTWFYQHFPESLTGSALADAIVKCEKEIDDFIVTEEKTDGIIEQIQEQYPGLVEGFYTPFKFASRRLDERNQKRLNAVLLVFIQEYGLGREIGPHLHWSGVYRSDEWLLGHFRNPSAHTAKSIMPVLPFDDSKFYMLSHMLHGLSQKNRERLHDIWHEKGFNPAVAYEVLCSSCHGTQRQGNGVISEWIYPIPKNLHNPVFLSHLTKERAIHSITHGIPGTPMPPWGESFDGSPAVLNSKQIGQLVEWLFQCVPQDSRVSLKEESEKWDYMPSVLVKEMQKEKDFLQPKPNRVDQASYFSEVKNTQGGPDQNLFHIKEIYYTPENLEAGKQFFTVNCASCHGSDGGGNGERALSMVEAKPRMLTNLPWIRSRDDLHLLRAIKYGVQGTAMTPWGDQTTAASRMQLVMYIRELSRKNLLQNELEAILYRSFDINVQLIEKTRIPHSREMEALKNSLQSTQSELDQTANEEKLSALFLQTRKLENAYEKLQGEDDSIQQLIHYIKEEKEIYSKLGSLAIASNLSEKEMGLFVQMIQEQSLDYALEDGKLIIVEKPSSSFKELLENLDDQNPFKKKLVAQIAETEALRILQKNILKQRG